MTTDRPPQRRRLNGALFRQASQLTSFQSLVTPCPRRACPQTVAFTKCRLPASIAAGAGGGRQVRGSGGYPPPGLGLSAIGIGK
jgi:hypothetical protein